MGNAVILDDSNDEEDSDTENHSEAEDSDNEDSGDESDPDSDTDSDTGSDDDDGSGDVAAVNMEDMDIHSIADSDDEDEVSNDDEDRGDGLDKVEDDTMEVLDATESDRAAMPPPAVPVRENSREQGSEGSLFVQSATPEPPRPFFVQKVETPSPPRTPPSEPGRLRSSSSEAKSEGTSARANREESSLFVGSPPPYQSLSPREGDRNSPIDMTGDVDVPPSASPTFQGQNKRPFASVSQGDNDGENVVDDEDECRCMGSSTKRARTNDDNSGGSGSGGNGNAAQTGPFIEIDDD
jgi:hypothetical protein